MRSKFNEFRRPIIYDSQLLLHSSTCMLLTSKETCLNAFFYLATNIILDQNTILITSRIYDQDRNVAASLYSVNMQC